MLDCPRSGISGYYDWRDSGVGPTFRPGVGSCTSKLLRGPEIDIVEINLGVTIVAPPVGRTSESLEIALQTRSKDLCWLTRATRLTQRETARRMNRCRKD